MKEVILNALKNNRDTICTTWSENKHIFSILQNVDENINNNAKENTNDCDNNSDNNELSDPRSLDSILPTTDHDCNFASYAGITWRDLTPEIQQSTSQNCIHYDDYRQHGCTNNATHSIESSSSESVHSPYNAKTEVELELELLDLVAEFSQSRFTEGNLCRQCGRGIFSSDAGFWDASEDVSINGQTNGCVKHRNKRTTTPRSTVRKQGLNTRDQRHEHTEFPETAMCTHKRTNISNSRCSLISDENVNGKLQQGCACAGENANGSSNFTVLATERDTVNSFKQKSCHGIYRESMYNYIPAKYWERQNLVISREALDIPLCPTTENYWQTAATEHIANPFPLASNENLECWEQSCNNTCGCNNITCDNSVHLLNKSSVCRFQQAGNYDHRPQRKHKSQEMKLQQCRSCSKTFPTGNFNEVIEKSYECLAVCSRDGQANNYCKTPTNFKRIKSSEHRATARKEERLSLIKSSDSRDQLRSHPLSRYVHSTDKKKEQTELPCPLWCASMQPFIQRTQNPQQYIDNKRNIMKHHRLKHSRTCRRRCGINGTDSCSRCLLKIPVDASRIDTTSKRKQLRKPYKNRKSSRSKYSKQKSTNTSSKRKCRRTTTTKTRKNCRRSKYATRSRRSPTSKSTVCRRSSRRDTYTALRHRDYKPRSGTLRRPVHKSANTRQVNGRRKVKDSGFRSGRYKTKRPSGRRSKHISKRSSTKRRISKKRQNQARNTKR